MKRVIYENSIKEFKNKIFSTYFGDMSYTVFDIETLGLSPHKHPMILGGFCYFDEKATCVQYFADNPDEENEILSESIEELQNFDFVITFNGSGFDLPFIKKRAEILGLEANNLPYHLDLYTVLRKFSDLKKFLPNMKQKTVETFAGLSDRTDAISGKKSIDYYFEYINTANLNLKTDILLHNSDDVFQLYRLLPILKKTDFHRAMMDLGFPVKTDSGICIVTDIIIKGEKLSIRGITKNSKEEQIVFSDFTDYRIGSDETFSTSISLNSFNDCLIADVGKIDLSNSPISSLPTFYDGYLVLKDNQQVYPFEINMLVKILTERIFAV